MYKKILVPLDGSKLAECVLPHLETVLKGCESPEVVLVQAVEPFSIPYGREVGQLKSLEEVKTFETHQKTDAEKYLSLIIARLEKKGIKARAEVIYGKAIEALTGYINSSEVDLVIMATHGRTGISRRVWGGVAEHVLRSVCTPILMIRAPGCVPGIPA
ncbi:MAG: universal stress protein [Dehalococcoidales bacterium]|nr:universal stress protein [Dehalococcoidales bacterium]